jgi:hypothetical protein
MTHKTTRFAPSDFRILALSISLFPGSIPNLAKPRLPAPVSVDGAVLTLRDFLRKTQIFPGTRRQTAVSFLGLRNRIATGGYGFRRRGPVRLGSSNAAMVADNGPYPTEKKHR